MHAFTGFYNKFPRTLEDKRTILKFLDEERECDEWNERQIKLMIASGECDSRKGRQKDALSATKRWARNNKQFTSFYRTAEPKSMAQSRNWYM